MSAMVSACLAQGAATQDTLIESSGADSAAATATESGPLAYSPCANSERIGAFVIELADDCTGVQGQVATAVTPSKVPEITASEGSCQLLQPTTLVCEPSCGPGTTCSADGECVPLPENMSIGPVAVFGLAADVAMEASPPMYFYTNSDPLPHPGFAVGAPISLVAPGREGEAISLRGQGIAPLEMSQDVLRLSPGQPAELQWEAPNESQSTQVHVDLNIANHGGTPARIDCVADDTGSILIPASLVDRLLATGYSGFPTVAIARQTVDSTNIGEGCLELIVRSRRVLDVLIPGLTSCRQDSDCPLGQTCGTNLMCR
jgi:hypothetical protein